MDPTHSPMLYRYIPVWRREQRQLSLYRVVEIIGVGFVVQSRDHFPTDFKQERVRDLDRQFLELLSEEAPEQRMRPEPSIRQAVAAFDNDFQKDN